MRNILKILAAVTVVGSISYGVNQSGPQGRVEKLISQVEKNEIELSGPYSRNSFVVNVNGKDISVRLDFNPQPHNSCFSYKIGDMGIYLHKHVNLLGGFHLDPEVWYNGERIRDSAFEKKGYEMSYNILENVIQAEDKRLLESRNHKSDLVKKFISDSSN